MGEPVRRARSRWLRFGVPEAVVLLAALGATFAVARPTREAKEAVAREEAALAAVRRTAEVLRGTGDPAAPAPRRTYDDLAGAGVVPPPPTGYALTILFPGRAMRDGRVAWVTEPAAAEPTGDARGFAVVARPRRRASGMRSFHLDSAGTLYVAEGVMDFEEKDFPPLPTSTFESAEDDSQPGTFWRRVGPAPD